MRVVLENKYGVVEMYGGGEGNIRISSISGTGIPVYERRLYSSFDFDGVVESVRRVPSRTISISGDIKGVPHMYRRLLEIIAWPCTMTIEDEYIRRMINVSSCESEFVKKGNVYTKFALSLFCDDPYFYDSEDIEVGLYVRNKLISDNTVLPAVFSTRTSGVSIKLESDRMIEPKIIILGRRNMNETEGKIVIKNTITNASFTLNYIPDDDEVVTVDVLNRTITSDIKGNIINCISDDSYISDLIIDGRGAEFVTMGYGAAGDISATLIYRNKYLEAIV